MSLEKLSEWLSSKSPRRSSFELSQRNIYIFPSLLGLGFLLLLSLMLLTAINYQNSLIYLLTFFLGTLFFLSIWMCFLNLSGLKVGAHEVSRCFEGKNQGIRYRIRLSKSPYLPLAVKAGVNKETAQVVPYVQGDSIDIEVLADNKPRGRYTLNRLYLESRFPFGLVVSWTWLKLDAECWVYPLPVQAQADGESHGEDDQQSRVLTSSSDMNDLKQYQNSDPTNRIIWKKYAARDELVIRHSESASINPKWVDWDHYSGLTEERLRHLCFDVCQLSDAQFSFGFKIPGTLIEPASSDLHRQKCLDALALFGK